MKWVKGGIAGSVHSIHLPNVMPLRTMQNILYLYEAKCLTQNLATGYIWQSEQVRKQ